MQQTLSSYLREGRCLKVQIIKADDYETSGHHIQWRIFCGDIYGTAFVPKQNYYNESLRNHGYIHCYHSAEMSSKGLPARNNDVALAWTVLTLF
jgi:hypothetical protein